MDNPSQSPEGSKPAGTYAKNNLCEFHGVVSIPRRVKTCRNNQEEAVWIHLDISVSIPRRVKTCRNPKHYAGKTWYDYCLNPPKGQNLPEH